MSRIGIGTRTGSRWITDQNVEIPSFAFRHR